MGFHFLLQSIFLTQGLNLGLSHCRQMLCHLSHHGSPLIKRFFSSFLLSAIRVISSAYLRLLIFLPGILIPAYNSFSLAFVTMCSAYKLNRRVTINSLVYSFFNLQGSNCCFLSIIQVSQETGKMIWYSHLSKNFPQFVMIHTVKGFSIVDETEIYIFLEFACFLYSNNLVLLRKKFNYYI